MMQDSLSQWIIRIWNAERQRHEYFGDWSLGDWSYQR